MNHARIRGFLLEIPRPSAIRVTCGEAEPQIIKPGKSASKTASTIEALGAELVECLDKSGEVIRAHRLDTVEARRSDSPSLPTGLEQDPQAAMLTHFANLIHRAYEHSTEIAFGKMVELVEKIGDRAESIEARLERAEAANRRLLADQVDDAMARAEEVAAEGAEGKGGSLTEQLAAAFLSGQMGQGATPQARANGKGKT